MTASTDNRIARIREVMAQRGVDLVALVPGAHMHWVLGYHPHPDERATFVLLSADNAVMVVPSVNAEDMRARAALPCFAWKDEDGPREALDQALAACGVARGARVSLDETARADATLLLMRALGITDLGFAHDTVGVLRAIKDADDVAALRRTATVADQAMQAGLAALRPGITERQAAAVIRDTFTANGVSVAFALVASGPNGAYPHHSTGNRVLQDGDAVVIDIGGPLNHMYSDMTRMAILGDGPEGYAEVHAVVEAAVQAALAAARPGVTAQTVDKAARDVITAAGYGEYFVHRTGHGMGIEVHEPPYITSTSTTILEAGMVFSIEPGIYMPGRFGIRLEDLVVLEPGGPRILSQLSRAVHRAG